jgi:AraC-like DNA-binding protein
LAHPRAHVVVEEGVPRLYGPSRQRFERVLRGRDRAVATRLRPGAARALVDQPLAALADRHLDLAGIDGAAIAAEPDTERAVELLDAALVALLPDEPSSAAAQAEEALALLESDRSVTRVGELAARLGVSSRTLQRLFADVVGVPPAEVARRHRLQEAATAATADEPVDWARLAADLGYCDQAHLVRDFTATIGTPPARYAAGGGA